MSSNLVQNLKNKVTIPAEFKKACSFINVKFSAYITAIIGYSLTEASVYITLPFIFKYVIDGAINQDFELIRIGLILVLILTVVACTAYSIFSYLLLSTTNTIIKELNLKLYRHTLKLPLTTLNNRHSGNTLSIFNNDLKEVDTLYRRSLVSITQTLFIGVGSFIGMLVINWIAAIFIVGICIILAVINRFMIGKMKVILENIQSEKARSLECISDVLSGFYTTRIFSLHDYVFNRFDDTNSKMRSLRQDYAVKSGFIDSINFLFGWFNFGGIIAIGAVVVSMGITQFGTIVALLNLMSGVNRMIRRLSSIGVSLQSSIVASNRIVDFIEQEEESKDGINKPTYDTTAAIDMKNVFFSYDGQKDILKDVNISINKGTVTALIGPSGGGKSSISKLLMGFYQPNFGSITINNKPIEGYGLKELRDLIAYVPQEPYMFEGTVEENIRIGKQDATLEEVIKAAQMVKAHESILQLSEGYQYSIKDQGRNLSRGQRQMISIARAILKDAPIVVLDEFTSSIDIENDHIIHEALLELMDGRTVLVISHKLHTIKEADVIYVINNGIVEGCGSHRDLMDTNQLYSGYLKIQSNE